jgi:hypothetical protein
MWRGLFSVASRQAHLAPRVVVPAAMATEPQDIKETFLGFYGECSRCLGLWHKQPKYCSHRIELPPKEKVY